MLQLEKKNKFVFQETPSRRYRDGLYSEKNQSSFNSKVPVVIQAPLN